MIESIARQSVILKCTMRKSILLGNYELYYVGGLIKKLFGGEASADMEPERLCAALRATAASAAPSDEREKYLLHLVEDFEPLPDYDEQMRGLFRRGETEDSLWSMQPTEEGDPEEKSVLP